MSPKGEQNDFSEIDQVLSDESSVTSLKVGAYDSVYSDGAVPAEEMPTEFGGLKVGTFIGPKVPGVNVDHIDVAAGVAKAAELGWSEGFEVMAIEYALNLWRRGEESLAKKVMRRDAKMYETSILVIVAAARAEGERKHEAKVERERAADEAAAEHNRLLALAEALADRPLKIVSTEQHDAWQVTEENGEALAIMLNKRRGEYNFAFVHPRVWDRRDYKEDRTKPRRMVWTDGDNNEHAEIGYWIILGDYPTEVQTSPPDLSKNEWAVVGGTEFVDQEWKASDA